MEPDLAARARRIDEWANAPGREAVAGLVAALREPSWYLRERAVLALAGRGAEAFDAVIEVAATGAWFARASACDVLGRCGDERAMAPAVAALLDRNVSLQKSAAEAVRALAERHGPDSLARALEALAPSERRAVTARLAHQVPEFAVHAAASLSPSAGTSLGHASEEDDVAALRRFRAWLASLVPREENA